jgi:uncharacterized protein YukJ
MSGPQGNPEGSHDQDNGVWQDGALFANLQNTWIAVFIAIQTQRWQTGDAGDPLRADAAAGN